MNRSTLPARGRALAAVALATSVALALAACDAATPSAAPTEPEPDPTPVTTVYPLDTTVWYAGFVVTFHRATAELDPRGGPVTVDARLENPSDESVAFTAPIRLTAAGVGYDLSRETKLSEVPAHGASEVGLRFDVSGRGSIDDAVLRVGASTEHQALVPLRPGAVAPVTLEPRPFVPAGIAEAADLKVTIRTGEVRWDLPDWLQELPHASKVVTLTYDVDYRGTFGGGIAFTADNVQLRLPDGTTVDPRRDGRSQSVALVLPRKRAENLFSRFEIPAETTGTCRLVIRNGPKTDTIAIDLPG